MLSHICASFVDAKKVTRDLEVAVSAAGRLKARMSLCQAIAELPSAGFAESFIGSPSPGCEALCLLQHLETVSAARRCFSLPSVMYACIAELNAFTWLYACSKGSTLLPQRAD